MNDLSSAVDVAQDDGADISDDKRALAGGCVLSLASAALTCFLLFLNGSLVLAILEVTGATGMGWVSQQGVSQFLLFALPVAMVVVQWIMIDYVRTRFHSRSS